MVGRTISHYEIVEKLGEGGMGVVYKAHDTHLDRFVAIKVLPPEKVADGERKRRFIQEAKSASALNHPHIITIHDIASDNGLDFIAMEYVPGKPLNQLIARRGLPLAEALKYAVQIADALAAAHAAGIIHRDLKPANVMVSGAPERSGFIKVLDFGLAKLTDKADSSDREFTQSVQQDDTPASGEGRIVGTVSYMSPEQAEGKKVDARSDIFSFGSLLYEMVTARRAFQGDSTLSTLSAVLREEPKPASQIVEGLPRELERIIARCLRKSPERRFQTMADLKVALEELKEESDSGSLSMAPVRQQRPRRRLVWAGALLAALTLGLGTLWFMRSPGKTPEAALNPVPLTTYPGFQFRPSFSPDGNQVAFVWNGEKQNNFDIYVKMIGANGPPLRLTTDAAPDSNPAWSPDGRFIAFTRDFPSRKRALMVIPAIGGLERKIAEIFPGSGRPAWSPDGNWLAISERDSETEPFALSLLSVDSGDKRRLTSPPKHSYGDFDPAFSPDGRSLAFSRGIDAHTFGLSDLYLLAFSAGWKPAGEPKQITFGNEGVQDPEWTADGREIVYSAGSMVSRGLWRISAFGHGAGRAEPQRLPSMGNEVFGPAVSRRGNRLAYVHYFEHVSIWRMTAPGPEGKRLRPLNQPTSLVSSTRDDSGPQFSPDGKKLAFESTRSGSDEIWVCDADGSNAVQMTSFGGPDVTTPRWSPDGGRIAFDSNAAGEFDIYVVGASGGKPGRMTTNPANDGNPSWSRDGLWIYFDSARTGEQQVWKMPANGGEAAQVTKDGGFAPLESPDGKSVYYTNALFSTSLWKMPIEGGEASKVLEGLSNYENVAIVGSGIYFVTTQHTTGDSSIRFLSFATSSISNLATFEKSSVYGLAVSPDGKWILYAPEQQVGSELMLVENFH